MKLIETIERCEKFVLDEIECYLFLPGNDCKVIDASVLYEVANKLEMNND